MCCADGASSSVDECLHTVVDVKMILWTDHTIATLLRADLETGMNRGIQKRSGEKNQKSRGIFVVTGNCIFPPTVDAIISHNSGFYNRGLDRPSQERHAFYQLPTSCR